MRIRVLVLCTTVILFAGLGMAQKKDGEIRKHESGLISAPESAHFKMNIYEGKPAAIQAGRKLYERHCAECHGANALGRGKAPGLDPEELQRVPPGDIFWFLTNGNIRRGMPSWSALPEARRWQIVSYLKSLHSSTEK
jgi:hypothetical protein